MPNRLALETSPYLLQHAHNPVDWFPWGQEAFDKARAENKPILLSVGYATCHWCHVMERESFENPEVAEFMNDHFVCIKVDREELPDVDQVYMSALQAMTGSGGWPMNMFLLPDLRPFYGGTYWPPHDQPNHPSFSRVLAGVYNAWVNQHNEVQENANTLVAHLQKTLEPQPTELPNNLQTSALASLARSFDPTYGGFGSAPKFPHSPALLYLLSHTWLGNETASRHLGLSLGRMAEAGIYDQIGGGFHRYATDAIWRVPHFEKMLYDNAQLVRVYLGAYKLSGIASYKRIVEETLLYIAREMTGPTGGFFSAQDADSEGVEGKFYVWSKAEFDTVLGTDAEAAAKLFGVSEAGNWEHTNILERRYLDEALRGELGLSEEGYAQWVDSLRQRLYEARSSRIRPITDDKVLADWNGLMLRALAEAGRLLEQPQYLEAARQNARFILANMVKDGLLRHSWRNGTLKPQAYLSDQANYGLGLLELYQATGELEWLEAAHSLSTVVFEHFSDPNGGFRDALETGLPLEAKDSYDGPYPSGSASASELLFRLSAIFERPAWFEAAYRAIVSQGANLSRNAFGYPALLNAHLLGTQGSELAIAEPLARLGAVRRYFLPLTTLATGLEDSIPLLQNRQPGQFYLCRNGACRLPTKNLEQLWNELDAIYKPKSEQG